MNADNLVGRTVAGYHLAKYIGEGGTATVYRADHPERGLAAVKILRPRLAGDPVAVKRFLREAEYGVARHPSQHRQDVRLRRSGRIAVPGARVGRRASRWPSSSTARASWPRRWSRPSSSSWAARSARPTAPGSSIAISSRPTSCTTRPTQTAKLLDFGIARDSELSPEERLTRAGFFVGTLQYVAPETLSGELVSEQADVYSLATITYYLLTQCLPFTGKSPRELFQQLLTQSPVPLNQAEKGLRFPPAVEAAVMHGLERDLSKRARRWTNSPARSAPPCGRRPEKKGGFFWRRSSGRAGSDRRGSGSLAPAAARAVGAARRFRARLRAALLLSISTAAPPR